MSEVVTVPGGGQFAVVAHPVGAVVTPDAEPTMYLDGPGTSSERLLGGLSYLYWRLFKGGRWEVEIIPYPAGDSPRWREEADNRTSAEARVQHLAASLANGDWP